MAEDEMVGWHRLSLDMNLSKLWEMVEDRGTWRAAVHGVFPGKNAGAGCHFLLQGIFPTQGSNPRLLHWQADSLLLSHQGSQMLIVTLSKNVLISLCSITCYEIIPCPEVMKTVSQMSFSNSVALPFTFNP